jgi:hypothetical protein
MSESSHLEACEGLTLDRRAFLGSVGLAAGAALAAAILPASVAGAAEAGVGVAANADGLWSVDVMCGHWPPYSHPIPYGRIEVAETAGLASAGHSPGLEDMLVA